MYNLESDEFISANNQDHYLNNNSLHIFEKFKLKYYIDNNNEEKGKIEMDNISNNNDQEIEIKSIENMINNNNNLLVNKIDENIFYKIKKFNNNILYEPKSINKEEDKKKEKRIIKFIKIKEIKERQYRKDYYYKHFKSLFGKYLKNKLNNLKNKCFPNFCFNNFSTPNYSFTGNPKEIDNFLFLSWSIKDILIYNKNKNKPNRQYNNNLIIQYIEKNEKKSRDKNVYKELINYLNDTLENAIIDFYENKNEFNKINQDEDCIFYNNFFKKETGISLLEKNGFLKIIKKNN